MTKQSSILRKGLGLIAIPLFFQLLFTGVLVYRQHLMGEAEHWAIHTKEIISEAETLLRNLMEADRNSRGFVMTSETIFAQDGERALAQIPARINRLKALVEDNPAQIARFDQIQNQIREFALQLAELRRTTAQQSRDQAILNLQQLFRIDPVKRIRVGIDLFIQEEDKLDRTRLSALHRFQDQQFWTLAAGAVALLAISGTSAWLFSQGIIQRLAVLNENVRLLSAGEPLKERVRGADEISALDASFHRMADDLTAAAQKENEYQENLERRSAELIVTNRELNQKSDENEMFVYSVSHDLRSPLVNLQGFSKELGLAMTDLKRVLDADEVPASAREQSRDILEHGMAEPIHFIHTAVRRLSAIIDALLRLSRAGRVEYQRSRVDVQAIVGRVVDAMRSTIAEKEARVAVAENLPSAWADATVVEQIFANLIGNALNYLDKNRPGFIEVGVLPPDEQNPHLVTYWVKDNGLGIPEAYSSKIFTIFQRVHGNIAPGEGIGLALVRRMVERHGGRIWVESKENVGSTFFVTLPREASPTLHQNAELPDSSQTLTASHPAGK
jgi:signal transduction histidine kinase